MLRLNSRSSSCSQSQKKKQNKNFIRLKNTDDTDTDGFCNQIGLKIDHIMSPYNRDTKKNKTKLTILEKF